MNAKSITIQGFLHEFKLRDKELPDQRFCFIIGAGASVRSGIPSGAAMVKEWIEQLHIREDSQGLSVAAWATSKNLGIDGFEYVKAASFYPQVFKRRFQDYPELGYAFLEAAMTDKEPSFGYSVLAQILAGTRHNVIITTNFDNLVVDALSFYCRKSPFVCGHESLTGFVRPQLKHALIAKIHRDLLLEPINMPEGTAKLATGWVKALTELLRYYMPIVIGYGGNDGSLMDFLNSLEQPIKGGIFWCYRTGSEPDEKVQAVVAKHLGRLVPIVGFDELMLQLQQQLGLSNLSSEIESRSKERLAAYRNQFEALLTEIQARGKDVAAEKAKEPVRQAAAAAVERITKEKDWWAWELKARQKTDPAEKEAVYREGLKDFPDSPQLLGNFALFMHQVRKNYDEAEPLYRKALELDPNEATITGNFALFMHQARNNYEEAEPLYRKALELDPNHANNTGNFADFMEKVRKNYDEAEPLYRKALELDPANATNTADFALFMEKVRENYDEAERLYRKALELDPANATNTADFALFMENVRKNYDEAERLYRKALELDPNRATTTGNFALFMENVRKNYDEAERLYRKALELDPNRATITGNFALFMHQVRKNYDEAERLYRKALELDPNQATTTGNFADFMEKVRKNYDEAERLYRKALELDPNQATNNGNFALFMENVRKNYDEAERLYRKALELDPANEFARKNYESLKKDRETR